MCEMDLEICGRGWLSGVWDGGGGRLRFIGAHGGEVLNEIVG